NCLFHCNMIPGSTAAEKTHGTAIDHFLRIEPRRTVHLTPEAEFCIFISTYDAGLGLAQACHDFLRIVANGRNDAHSSDDDTSHDDIPLQSPQFIVDWATDWPPEAIPQCLQAQAPPGCKASSCLNNPTLRSVAREMILPAADSQPSAMPNTSFERMTRLISMP